MGGYSRFIHSQWFTVDKKAGDLVWRNGRWDWKLRGEKKEKDEEKSV